MNSVRERNRGYRQELFRHLDGIAMAPTMYELNQRGVLQKLLESDSFELEELTSEFRANEGYLNVALKLLASQGWLAYHVDNSSNKVTVNAVDRSALAFQNTPIYDECVRLMKFSEKFHNRVFEQEPFEVWLQIASQYQTSKSEEPVASEETIVKNQMLKHVEGVLVGPTAVLLGMGGMFHKYFMETSFSPSEYHKDPEAFSKILDFFSSLGWFEKKNNTYRFTEKGLFFAKRSAAYGVTVSYIPTFRHLDQLIFGDPLFLDSTVGEPEKKVDREMNVWGSGGAHVSYFKKIDEILVDFFNRSN